MEVSSGEVRSLPRVREQDDAGTAQIHRWPSVLDRLVFEGWAVDIGKIALRP
jgi:hypothetical protein